MPEHTAEPRFGPEDVGCYLDGHFGWHNTYRVIELAEECGFVVTPADREYVERFKAGAFASDETAYEIVHEISNDALDHLQSRTAPGLYWVWDEGGLDLLAEDQIDW